jgi:hypothetical protein
MSTMSKKYELDLAEATSYEEWCRAARELDHLEGLDKWREEPESEDYLQAARLARQLLRALRRRTSTVDFPAAKSCTATSTISTLALSACAFRHPNTGHGLYRGLRRLNLLCDSEVEKLPPMRKRIFSARHAQLRPLALLLSGGASLGLFHIGVFASWKFRASCRADHRLQRVPSSRESGARTRSGAAINDGDWRFEWARLVGLTDSASTSLLDQRCCSTASTGTCRT